MNINRIIHLNDVNSYGANDEVFIAENTWFKLSLPNSCNKPYLILPVKPSTTLYEILGQIREAYYAVDCKNVILFSIKYLNTNPPIIETLIWETSDK